jgi:hypothetical protein
VSADVTELINKHVSTCTYFRNGGWTISLRAVLYQLVRSSQEHELYLTTTGMSTVQVSRILDMRRESPKMPMSCGILVQERRGRFRCLEKVRKLLRKSCPNVPPTSCRVQDVSARQKKHFADKHIELRPHDLDKLDRCRAITNRDR